MRNYVLFFLLYFFSFASLAYPPTNSFAEAEHAAAGDNVKIYLSATDHGESAHLFHLVSGVHATYGEILTFGDVYGTPSKAISQGNSAAERRKRFLDAFHSFATNPQVVTETNQILDAIHHEQKVIGEEILKGKEPQEAYKNQKSETARRFNCITGGGCDPKTWWLKSGRYLDLAKNDYDHFGSNAWIAYQTGHTIAMEEAIAARETHDVKRLERAYAMNAFASHFLSDRFATGHIRSPRVELPLHVNPHLVGTILVTYMHNEENTYGLHVHNRVGDRWIAYGDQMYFSTKAATHREMLNQTLQASANQIFVAYVEGKIPDNDYVYDLIPEPDETAQNSNIDIAPLFYWDASEHKLMRRVDVTNAYDRHWTSDWWGWTTLSLLIDANGELPGQVQSELAKSNYAALALKDGFITNKALIDYLRAKSK